jgi:hypothetical protein
VTRLSSRFAGTAETERAFRALLAAVILALAVAACGGAGSTDGSRSTAGPAVTSSLGPAETATPGASVPALDSPVTGVLTHLDTAGLSAVSGFTLRLDDGREVAFKIGVLENGAQFPPGHLGEHLASAEPVRVYFRASGADLVVYRIEDASESPAAAAS